ncbi:MAG TPA: tetratricopeptide repeat protein [Gemmatimonadales bacterium]|nr:tetratricopeptide repeat protein [Gemmatimonadales bacterium]
MSLEKLKDTARKFEQKEDWRKAIEAYVKAIQQMESGREAAPDLSLYNRVGDLYLKINDTQAAVRHYERAVDLYADQGFFNNAIALCGKILRVNPGRTQSYLKLAQLHARKNVVIEAKRNLLEFIERMNAQGQLDEAFGAVKEFADQFSGSQEIRLMLVELLRASQRPEEAHEQLDKLCTELEASGDVIAARRTRERIEPFEDGEQDVSRRRGGDLIFLDTGFGGTSSPPAAAPVASVPAPEPVVSLIDPPPTVEEPAATLPGLVVPERLTVEPEAADSAPLGDIIRTGLEVSPDDVAAAQLLEGIQLDTAAESGGPMGIELDIERPEPADVAVQIGGVEPGDFSVDRTPDDERIELGSEVPNIDLSAELNASLADTLAEGAPAVDSAEPSAADLDLMDPAETAPGDAVETAAAGAAIAELEQAVADRPDDGGAHRALAEELLRVGDTARAREELEFAAHGYETAERWDEASEVVGLLVTLTPADIRNHQKLVEFAYRSGNKPRLIEAYLALAEALVELGEREKAHAVYQRVVDHEPEDERAQSALRMLDAPGVDLDPIVEPPVEPPPAEPPPRQASRSGEFVDLGSLVMDDGAAPRRDTRMRVEGLPPTEDEQRNFEETLAAFKRGIEENVELEDYHTHYDLGVAFKEMGLLDEAIAEFQKALRATEGRLRTAEALGTAFFDKGQFGVAENLLRRAVETLAGADEEKIGLLYWLGRAREAQGKNTEAVGAYERALAVDIRFMDIGERVQRLGAGRR